MTSARPRGERHSRRNPCPPLPRGSPSRSVRRSTPALTAGARSRPAGHRDQVRGRRRTLSREWPAASLVRSGVQPARWRSTTTLRGTAAPWSVIMVCCDPTAYALGVLATTVCHHADRIPAASPLRYARQPKEAGPVAEGDGVPPRCTAWPTNDPSQIRATSRVAAEVVGQLDGIQSPAGTAVGWPAILRAVSVGDGRPRGRMFLPTPIGVSVLTHRPGSFATACHCPSVMK